MATNNGGSGAVSAGRRGVSSSGGGGEITATSSSSHSALPNLPNPHPHPISDTFASTHHQHQQQHHQQSAAQSQVHQQQVQLQKDLPERVSLLSLEEEDEEECYSTPPSITAVQGTTKFHITSVSEGYPRLQAPHRNNSTSAFATGIHHPQLDAMIFNPVSRLAHHHPASPLAMPLPGPNGKRQLHENGPLLGGPMPPSLPLPAPHIAALRQSASSACLIDHTPSSGSRLAMNMMGATTAIAMSMTPPQQAPSSLPPVPGNGHTINHHSSSPTSSVGGAYNKLDGTLKLKLRGGFEPHHLEPLNK